MQSPDRQSLLINGSASDTAMLSLLRTLCDQYGRLHPCRPTRTMGKNADASILCRRNHLRSYDLQPIQSIQNGRQWSCPSGSRTSPVVRLANCEHIRSTLRTRCSIPYNSEGDAAVKQVYIASTTRQGGIIWSVIAGLQLDSWRFTQSSQTCQDTSDDTPPYTRL